jgi:hypothetical protein
MRGLAGIARRRSIVGYPKVVVFEAHGCSERPDGLEYRESDHGHWIEPADEGAACYWVADTLGEGAVGNP